MTAREQLLLAYGILEGQQSATWDLAICKDGSHLVGVMQVPYKVFVEKWGVHQGRIRAKLKLTHCEIVGCQGCPACQGIIAGEEIE